MTKTWIALLMLTFPDLSHASCFELVAKGSTGPVFGKAALYECDGTVRGAETFEEGAKLADQAAQAQAASFEPIRSCRQLGLDRLTQFRSFCDPQSACMTFVTRLYFSCGHSE